MGLWVEREMGSWVEGKMCSFYVFGEMGLVMLIGDGVDRCLERWV